MDSNVSLLLAFGAGLLSFISPCCLPLYPSFLSYITGITAEEVKKGPLVFRRQAMFHTLFFITGFSIVFVALGLSTSLLGSLFSDYQELVRQIGGILLVLLGLIMVGFFKTEMLMKSWKIEVKNRPLGYFGSVIVGVTYAAGWTPCVGPILSSIIVLGVTNPTNAIYYTLAYTLGFAIPFFLMTFFISKINAIAKYSERFMKIGGAFMILFGILLYTNKMTDITVFLIRLYGGFTGF